MIEFVNRTNHPSDQFIFSPDVNLEDYTAILSQHFVPESQCNSSSFSYILLVTVVGKLDRLASDLQSNQFSCDYKHQHITDCFSLCERLNYIQHLALVSWDCLAISVE